MGGTESFNDVNFSYLSDSIRNKKEMNYVYKLEIDDARKIFKNIIRGLESIVNVEDLEELTKLAGCDNIANCPTLQIKEVIARYKEILKSLDELETDAEGFYKKEFKAENLLHMCEKMRNFYERKLSAKSVSD
jgi:hypothetical protein